MKNILFIMMFLSISLFGATNELINPKGSTIIDIGYKQPQADYSVTVPKDWVSYNSLVKTIDKMIYSLERDLSPKYDCEIDYLGRENCTEQSFTCNAKLQQDIGIAEKITKYKFQNKVKKSVPREQSDNPNQIKGDMKLAPTVGAINGSKFNLVYNVSQSSGILPAPSTLFSQGYQKNGKFAVKMFHYGSGCGGFGFNVVPDTVSVLVNGGSTVRKIPFQRDCRQLISSDNGQYAIVLAEWNSIPASLTYQCDDFCLMGKPSDEDFGFWAWACDNTFIDADGIKSSVGKCKKEYSYFNYKCKPESNTYDKPWVGPVINSGGDCNANCGPYGCLCNSSSPPANNCIRDTYICPFDGSQLCTITTDEVGAVSNVIDNFIYSNGTADTYNKTVLVDKLCKEGKVLDKTKNLCELEVNEACSFGEGFTLDRDFGECVKPIGNITESCSSTDFEQNGFYINSNGVKQKCTPEEFTSSCQTGYTYNSTKKICEAIPRCDNGTYNLITNKCELTNSSCPAGYTYNTTRQRCEKSFEFRGMVDEYINKERLEFQKQTNCNCGWYYGAAYEAFGHWRFFGENKAALDSDQVKLFYGGGYVFKPATYIPCDTGGYSGKIYGTPIQPLFTMSNPPIDMSCSYTQVTYYCPVGYTDNGSNCKKDICPAGYTLYPNGSNTCYKEETPNPKDIPNKVYYKIASCPTTATLDIATGSCNFVPYCKEDGVLNTVSDRCDSPAFNKCEGNMFCSYEKSPVCDAGDTYNSITNKCESEPYCQNGFIDTPLGCKKDYTYSEYKCPTDFIGPLDAGADCFGNCGANGCACNAPIPPANNCKKPYTLTGTEFKVYKERPLQEVIVNGAVTPKEFGVYKGFDCGENCLFTVEKIIGKDNKLCFSKENKEEECITVYGCNFEGEIKNNVYPNDIYDINIDDAYTISLMDQNHQTKMEIKSTCKMNGHVGWHSRKEGITSVIRDPENKDRLLFWDSYLDKNLGFIEFIKEVKEEDKEDGFLPQNNFLYEMLSQGFTATEAVEGSTIFVSSKVLTETECNALAEKNSLVKGSIVSPKVKELTKILSGDRYEIQYKEPGCLNGLFLPSINKCISYIGTGETNCANGKYDTISLPTEIDVLRKHAIWDNSQGDNITISSGFFAPKDGLYKINLGTVGNAQLFIDGSIVAYAQHNTSKEVSQNIYLNIGIHEVKVIARKDSLPAAGGSIVYGNRGFGVIIKDPSGNTISTSNHWCKNTDTTVCPTDGFSKIGNICLETSLSYCPSGTYDEGLGKCVLLPKCVLAKAGEMTYKEQTKSVKEEIRDSSKMNYKCSPLKCVNNQCQTADCPYDANGVQYNGKVFMPGVTVPTGSCTEQSCDANRDYYKYCGKDNGCDITNPLVYEDNGVCKEVYCATGYVMDINTKKCKKLECPEGTTAQTDGSCKRN